MIRFFTWSKNSVAHKLSHFSLSNLREMFIEHGISLVVIFILWEILEDVISPAIFIWLGINVNETFYVFAPLSWLLCFHWVAVPALWAVWIKIVGER